ncbi:hypothetical protein FB567DRAFT_448296 [Paraphoma chrysanthemicola]|uniref:BZIP domain-containing protein n=1 Tax=Paraphoma chrysanthemicola TaxID=798071 RepID=A0A8K0VWD6_9PLEO|nr:hypothetical protein FB567DRAFT_448296 [Paraphoma chrysanthemicola]
MHPTERQQLDPEAQKARKRAWDRAAQRKLRQNTKNRLQHLENTINTLKNNNKDEIIARLMNENEGLRKEIQRLQDIISGTIATLQNAGSAISSASEGGHVPIRIQSSSSEDEAGIPMSSEALQTLTNEPRQRVSVEPQQVPLNEPPQTLSSELHHEIPNEPQETVLSETEHMVRSPTTESPLPPDLHQILSASSWEVDAWETANQIFGGIAHVDVMETLIADTIDMGPLIKGIHLGWNSLSQQQKRNPSVRILQQMDESIWASMPKTPRAAIACKSYMLLRYLFNPDSKTLNDMPEWEQPSHLQRYTRHPIAISFFPWPALRERLILNQELYLGTCDFFEEIISNCVFTWPYDFEDTFTIDDGYPNEYRVNPLFVEYVRDLGNWTMAPSFFAKFPELLSDIFIPRPQPPNGLGADQMTLVS